MKFLKNKHTVRDTIFAGCMKEMRDRLKVLSVQPSKDDSTMIELRALQLAIQLTFDEFIIVMKSYRHVSLPSQRRFTQVPRLSSTSSPLASNSASSSNVVSSVVVPLASVVSGSREYRGASAVQIQRSNPRNSPMGSRHGSLGSEDDNKTTMIPGTAALARASFAARNPSNKSEHRSGSVGSETDTVRDSPVVPKRDLVRRKNKERKCYILT
jgi:hypothetical protein